MKNTVELFFDFQRKKNIKRYGICPEAFHESVGDHCSAMIDMADDLMTRFDLGLDYRRVIKIIKYHDMGELGLAQDYNASVAEVDSKYKDEKTCLEKETIAKLIKKYGKEIKEFTSEYLEQKTREAKFVKLLDRLDAMFWQVLRGVKNYKDMEIPPCLTLEGIFEGIITKANKLVIEFPQLKEFYREFQKAAKIEYLKNGLPWNDEYFI